MYGGGRGDSSHFLENISFIVSGRVRQFGGTLQKFGRFSVHREPGRKIFAGNSVKGWFDGDVTHRRPQKADQMKNDKCLAV